MVDASVEIHAAFLETIELTQPRFAIGQTACRRDADGRELERCAP
jgi:hypothetical protein